MPGTFKRKYEVEELAAKVIDFLRPEGLVLWQAKEVLKFAIEQLEYEKLNKR